MKVWWCEEHECTAEPHTVWCVARFWAMDAYETRGVGDFEGSDCRIVEMQLVPADALVVEKVAGQWPDWAERFVAPHSLDDFLEAQDPPKDPWDYDP